MHVPSLITVQLLLLIKSQFTTNAQNVLHFNQCTQGHVLSWNVASFQRSRGGCEWFDTHQMCVGKMSIHFSIPAAYARSDKCPADKNVKERLTSQVVSEKPQTATSVCVTKQTHYKCRIITDRTRSKIRISHGRDSTRMLGDPK
jgi:hypothetical protein